MCRIVGEVVANYRDSRPLFPGSPGIWSPFPGLFY